MDKVSLLKRGRKYEGQTSGVSSESVKLMSHEKDGRGRRVTK